MPHGTVKKKRRGDINMRRKEAKSSRITNGAIVYLGKSRELPKKLLELVREFSKAELINSANLQGTKSLHKNLGAFLY